VLGVSVYGVCALRGGVCCVLAYLDYPLPLIGFGSKGTRSGVKKV